MVPSSFDFLCPRSHHDDSRDIRELSAEKKFWRSRAQPFTTADRPLKTHVDPCRPA